MKRQQVNGQGSMPWVKKKRRRNEEEEKAKGGGGNRGKGGVKEEKIRYYISNRDKLKIKFNQCHKKYIELKKSKTWKEANESLRTYQCDIVGKAAAKLKVYSFNKPLG